MNSCRQDWDNTIRPFDAPAPLSVWLPPSSKPAQMLAFCLDPTRPKTCRLASHMHIKPGELENILLARELEELPEPRAVDWPQALGLTTLDPGVFFPSPSYLLPSDVVLTLHVLPFCFEVFLSIGKKNHLHCVLGKELQHLSFCPVWLPFPLPPLFLLPYLCENGVAVTSERKYWSLQISNSCSGGWFFCKSSIKKSNVLEIHLSLQVFPFAHVFSVWLHLLLISLFHEEMFLLVWQQITFESSSADLEFKMVTFQLLFGFINI